MKIKLTSLNYRILFIRPIFLTFVNFLILRYLQFSHLFSSRFYGVVEKYHGILKTCYLQNVQTRDMNNHNQRAIVLHQAKRIAI